LFTLGSVWCGIARRMGELYAAEFACRARIFAWLTGIIALPVERSRAWEAPDSTAWLRCVFSNRVPVGLRLWERSLG